MTPDPRQSAPPSPALFFDTANAHQRTDALKTAVELSIFTAIGEGKTSPKDIAAACGTVERGARILCDYLVVIGFLTKQGTSYGLTADTAMFLDKHSPAYMGGCLDFLLSPMLTDNFKDLTAAVRRGGSSPTANTVSPENPVWVQFARAMAPMMALPSQLLAPLADPSGTEKIKVLDIAAGHGLYGIAFAKRNPQAEITAVDWQSVLEVAKENARAAGVSDRYQTRPGDAMTVDFGAGYDIVLLTNFLHHFDVPSCENLLRKVHAALGSGGRAVTLEFIPNPDRVSPPQAAAFSLMMLGGTLGGDAYTFAEFESMFRNAGFTRSEMHELPPTIERVVISQK